MYGVIGRIGIMTDLLVYSIVIPVLPFQLERLGYSNISGLVGWLLFGYVCIDHNHIDLHADLSDSQPDSSYVSSKLPTFSPYTHSPSATPPIALFSERYNTRTWPLIAGQIILIGSQIMLMEAPTYWLMVLARIIQGVSSSIIWVVGLALL